MTIYEPSVSMHESPTPERLSIRQRLHDAYYMAGAEFTNTSLGEKALFGATVSGVAFELGPGNEWLLGAVGANTYKSAGNVSSTMDYISSNLTTGGVTGLASAFQQATVGFLTALSIRKFPGTLEKMRSRRDKELSEPNNSSIKGSVADALALGTSAVVLMRNANNPERKLKDDITVVAKGSVAVGGFNVVLVGGVSTIVRVIENSGHEKIAEAITEVALNPVTYLAGYAVAKVIGKIHKNNSA